MTSQSPPVFYIDAKVLLEDAQSAVAKTRSCLDSIIANVTPTTATFENTVLPFAQDENERLWTRQFVEFHQNLDNEEIRDAAEQAVGFFEDLDTEIGMRQDFYDLIVAVKETDAMDHEDRRFLKKLLLSYKKSGLNLSAKDQNRFREIQGKLSDLASQYGRTMSTSQCLMTKEELGDHGQDLKEVDGKYLITQPAYIDIVTNSKNSDLRRKVWIAFNHKNQANAALLDQMLPLRHELAQLRGYPTSAAYELAHSEVGTADQIESLLTDLGSKVPSRYREIEKDFAKLRQDEGESDVKVYPWDRSYYTRLLMAQKFNTKPLWFPVKETIEVMLDIFSEIFEMSFTPSKAPVWHDDVKVYEVHSSQEFVGYLYMDLHFRPGRISHNSDQPVRPAFVDRDGKRRPTATALMCSLRQDLMQHDDMIMAFHELGHGIHDLVAKTKYARFHGASTGGFNETPSQMLENWCWHPAVLSLFKGIRGSDKSGENGDGETEQGILSEKELQSRLEALLRARSTSRLLRQHTWLEFTLFDQAIHGDANCKDTAALWHQRVDETYRFCNVPHWSHGACGCYVYLMCDVYSSDMFESAFAENPMDCKVAMKYKNAIISNGSTEEPIDMVKDFLGREPRPDAFYSQLGIA